MGEGKRKKSRKGKNKKLKNKESGLEDSKGGKKTKEKKKKTKKGKEQPKKKQKQDQEYEEKKRRKKNKQSKKELEARKKKTTTKPKKAKTDLSSPLAHKPFPLPHRFVLAPMVGGSELPFRMMCRKYGAQLCYTPMMYSKQFVEDPAYREEAFQTHSSDRPLVAHFCGNDPNTLLKACKLVEGQVDAVDINLGCPQRIACSGHFGSFLLDENDHPLVMNMVNTLAKNLRVPVCVKMRLLPTLQGTIEFCEALQKNGASLIAIHARYRGSPTQPRDGPAHLEQITEIMKHLSIPVLANGNVRGPQDFHTNMELTKANGIMVAESALDNPAIFAAATGKMSALPHKLALAKEYLKFVERFPPIPPLKCIKYHVRRILRQQLSEFRLADELNCASSLKDVAEVLDQCTNYEEEGFDVAKAEARQKAVQQRRHLEKCRQKYEARMARKKKRLEEKVKQSANCIGIGSDDKLHGEGVKRTNGLVSKKRRL